MTPRLTTAVFVVFTLTGLTACLNTDTAPSSPDNPDVQSSGIALTGDTLADTDVTRLQFDVIGVDCQTGTPTGVDRTRTRDLEDMMLPGGIAKFENSPFTDNSRHLFADAFFLVDAGCYNVTTTPLRANGRPSQDCQPAHKDRVAVEDSQTTEILLINQCEGAERGGLDAVSAVNHPPEIDDLEFQKFLASCPTAPQDDEVCVTASDPDKDPLEFEWVATDSGEFEGDVVETTRNKLADGRWESCADVATIRRGGYAFEVRVFDLDGDGTRMEQVLVEQNARDAAASRDSLQFPIYAGVDCPNVGDISNPTTLRQLAEVKTATRAFLDHGRTLETFARFTPPIPGRGVNHIRRSLITDRGTIDWDRAFEEGSAQHRRTPAFLWFDELGPGSPRLLAVSYAVPTTQTPPLDLFAGDHDDDEWHVHPAVDELIPPVRSQFRRIAGACHYKSGGEIYLAVTTDGRKVLASVPTGEILPGDWSAVEPAACPGTGPFGSDFRLVHGPIWNLTVWLYRDNPAGLFHGPNPTVGP